MSTKILLGFVAGAATGIIAGILFAPDKGSATRQKIASKTGDLADSVKESFADFIDGLKETYGGAKAEVEKFGEQAKNSLQTGAEETYSKFS